MCDYAVKTSIEQNNKITITITVIRYIFVRVGVFDGNVAVTVEGALRPRGSDETGVADHGPFRGAGGQQIGRRIDLGLGSNFARPGLKGGKKKKKEMRMK